MKRYIIQAELVGIHKQFPMCMETTCGFSNECANHNSADKVRIEEGLTPDIKLDDGNWTCSRQPHNHFGALFANGSLPYLERWATPEDIEPSKQC